MSASDRSFNEKRDFIRMKINSTVNVSHNGTDYECVCKDLSGTGMSITSDFEFPVGDQVDILIEQENESHLPFHALAEVSRVQHEEAGNFVIGLSIKEIND